MTEYNIRNGAGSVENQSSEIERVPVAPGEFKETEIPSEKENNEDKGAIKLIQQTEATENTLTVDNSKQNEDVNLDEEERYNREVQGAEADISLDDLLASNKDNIQDTETDIVPTITEVVEQTIKIDTVKVNVLNGICDINGNVNPLEPASVENQIIVEHVCTDNDIKGDEHKEIIVAESQNCLEMPEIREETEGCMSPSLMFAMCRYRWEKTIVTQSDSVVFVTLNNKEIEPIKLVWTENSKCFYSEEFKIPTGKYVGNLVIDGVFYPVEDITVKHYTFEVDLYLKDDIIDDEVDKTGISKAEQFLEQRQNGSDIDTFKDISYTAVRASTDNYTDSRASMEEEKDQENKDNSIHISSKYEDLVRSQMSHTKSALSDNMEVETDMFENPVLSRLDGRRSPVGDDGGKQYQDGDAAVKELDMNHVYHMNGDTTLKKEYVSDSVIQDDVERRSGRLSNASGTGSGAHTPQAVIDDVLGNGQSRAPVYSTETPVYSRNSSAHSSARHTPVLAQTQDFTRESVHSDSSGHSLEKHIVDDLIDSSLKRERFPTQMYRDSRSGSERSTPQAEQIADVLNPADRHSPIRREYLVGSPHVSDSSQRGSEHGSAHGSAHSSQRQTPQKDIINDSLRASHEKLYIGQDFRRSTEKLNGSLSGGSSHGSRPQSLTSEQELTQYYELTGGSGSSGLPPVSGVNGGQVQRTGSASSLPTVGTQKQSFERRSMTPDNHIRVPVTGPIIKSSLLPNRNVQRTPGSNTSSRTVTPVNTAIDAQEHTRLQERIMDLENTVSNVRTLLASREKEVFELKGHLQDVREVNRSLQEELDQRRARVSPGLQIAELERQYREVVDEKEVMAAELFRLKDELRRKEEEPSLNSYDPNGPQALQRKIDDLQSQIQDLQEANESAVEEISAAENKIKQLAGDNETLRATQASNMRDLEEDNRHLKNELSRLKEQTSHSEVSDYRLKIELQQVKEDNRGLRERNYQLHDDNIKLKEELATLRKSLEAVESNRKSYIEDRHSSRNIESYKSHEPKLKSVDSSYRSEHLDRDYKSSEYLSDLKPDLGREKEREKHVYSYTTPGYDSKLKYDVKTERVRGERSYEDERYTSVETSARYDSHRSVPDGGSNEKSTTRSRYEPRPLTPERPSALGPPKRETQYYSSPQSLDRSKIDRLESDSMTKVKRERSRTSSADRDFKSAPLSQYSDLSKTMPALSGRSRAIYKSLSDLRSRSRSRSPSSRQLQYSESSADSHDNQKYSKTVTQSSKIFIKPHLPSRKQSNKWADETRLRISPDHGGSGYTRSSQPVTSVSRKHTDTYTREDKGLDHRQAVSYQDDGDASDTATDILVNAQPLERLPTTAAWNRTRPRRGSVGSDGSNSSFSDIDEQLSAAARKRSKSADGREVLRRMGPTVTLSRSGPTTPVPGERTASSNAGFRSITPQPLATQHNKTSLSLSPGTISLTQGLRPFAPRSAADLQVSDVIKFSRQGGKLSQGTIKFIGHLPGRGDIYLGVELDKEDGKHDGTFEGIRYFKCKPSKGVFVAYNKVVMAWTA